MFPAPYGVRSRQRVEALRSPLKSTAAPGDNVTVMIARPIAVFPPVQNMILFAVPFFALKHVADLTPRQRLAVHNEMTKLCREVAESARGPWSEAAVRSDEGRPL